MIGYEFANFKVIGKEGNKWICQCVCGNKKLVSTSDIKREHCKSCGCMFKGKKIKHTHKNRIYGIWKNMIRRCCNLKSKDYKNYGAKGIKICDEWLKDFSIFEKWALENGYNEKLTIDRIDNLGNYEPNNCKWATMQEQHNNYSQNVYYTYNGKTQTQTQWAKEYNLNLTTLIYRIKKYGFEKAINMPLDKSKSHKRKKD